MSNPVLISFANHKGGVGKTTSAVNVGAILARRGFKVLLLDLDAQAQLTYSLYKPAEEIGLSCTIYPSLIQGAPLQVVELSPNLSLVPSSLQLAMIDIELSSAIARERILSEILEKADGEWDYILIDCPPYLGLLTLNAFTASDGIIIPLVPEALPGEGLKKIGDFINTVTLRLNHSLRVLGILETRWEGTNLNQTIEASLSELPYPLFKTKIRKNVKIAEAPKKRMDVVSYAPQSNGAKDYIAFTEELISLCNNQISK